MGNSDQGNSLEKLTPIEHYPYASYLKGRTGGDFKRHKTLAHAKAAVNQRIRLGETHLYRWHEESGKWLELFL